MEVVFLQEKKNPPLFNCIAHVLHAKDPRYMLNGVVPENICLEKTAIRLVNYEYLSSDVIKIMVPSSIYSPADIAVV